MPRTPALSLSLVRAFVVVAVSAVMAVAGAAGPAAAVEWVDTDNYVWDGHTMTAGVAGAAPLICTERLLRPLGPDEGFEVGGGCFDLPATGGLADITISDASGAPVVGRYAFQVDADTTASHGFFCGSVSDLPVPPDAQWLLVYVLAQVGGGTCPADSPATAGEITMRLH